MGAILAALALAFAPAHIDGISDQSVPYWDGAYATSAFARTTFAQRWEPALRYERFVVPYDVTRFPGSRLYRAFADWYAHDIPAGVLPMVALWYGEDCWTKPGFPAACRAPAAGDYAAALAQLLHEFPWIRVLEAWNEPNGAGELAGEPARAAAYYDVAAAACACTVVAADLVDTPGAGAYAGAYRAALTQPAAAWGVHPYLATAYGEEAGLDAMMAQLPAGTRPWFTEVGAYQCDAHGDELGVAAQTAQARRLVDVLLPRYDPAHTVYYELMYGGNRDPASDCPDTALYGARDEPRPAASLVLGGLGHGADLLQQP